MLQWEHSVELRNVMMANIEDPVWSSCLTAAGAYYATATSHIPAADIVNYARELYAEAIKGPSKPRETVG